MEQLGALDASFLYSGNERVANHIGGLYIDMNCFRDPFEELRAAMLPQPSSRPRPVARARAAWLPDAA